MSTAFSFNPCKLQLAKVTHALLTTNHDRPENYLSKFIFTARLLRILS